MKTFSPLATPEAKHALISKVLKSLKHYPNTILSLDTDKHDGLELFIEKHQVFGTVTQKSNLAARKALLTKAKISAQSLLGFRFPQNMQLIYLLDQKIITLIGAAKREKIFERVLEYLEPYGIFIFDVYMGSYFADMQKHTKHTSLSDTQVSISSWKEKKGIYEGKETSFLQVEESDMYQRTDRVQSYQTFALSEIKKMLNGFGEVRILDRKGKKQNKKSAHIVIVAQKGRQGNDKC